MKKILAATLVAFAPLVAHADVITTTFASDNGFAGNMFDLTVMGSEITITDLAVNVDPAGETAEISVWTRIGGYMGFEMNPAGWTLQSSTSAIAAGENIPTNVDVTDFSLMAGTTYGVYVAATNYPEVGINYTSGSNTYSNGDLLLSLGIGRGDGFASSVFNPRTWNGSITYNVGDPNDVPVPATLGLLLIGLAGFSISRRRKAS